MNSDVREERIKIDKTFNSVGIDTIREIETLEDVRKHRKFFQELSLTDEEILRRCKRITENNSKVEALKKIPVVEQRSEEWYNLRQTLITASDFGQALGVGKFGSVKDFFIKKVGYQEVKPLDSAILKHGVRYEPVATKFYEKLLNTTVHEFGLLRHPQFEYLGASPDGINDFGRMVEIKCPAKRKITGEIVEQYYIQMQGQLDVCQLQECDFLECAFKEYLDEIDFDEDWNDEFTFSKEGHQKGVIIEVDDQSMPIYSDPGLSRDQYRKWFKTQMKELHDKDFDIIYYRLTEYSLQTIERDDEFLSEKNSLLGETWNKIVKYKGDKECYDKEIGYKSSPKRRPVKCLFRDIE